MTVAGLIGIFSRAVGILERVPAGIVRGRGIGVGRARDSDCAEHAGDGAGRMGQPISGAVGYHMERRPADQAESDHRHALDLAAAEGDPEVFM